MASSSSKLTELQWDFIRAVFAQGDDTLRLTGGAALAGFHLAHRATDDIDLFASVPSDLLTQVRHLDATATAIGATMLRLQTSPNFVRSLLRRGESSCEIDLAVDSTVTVAAAESQHGIRLDPLREIAANKVTTLLSRTEVRDLVDLYWMVRRAGVSLDQAYEDALRKEAGLSPDTLQMTIGWIPLQEAAALKQLEMARPEEELQEFRASMQRFLRRLAFPG